MASVHCPRDKNIISMSNCPKCKHIRKDADISTVWCRFNIGKTTEPVKDHRYLYAQINHKERLAERFYKTGKPKIADQIIRETMLLKKQLKQIKGEI